MNKIKEFYENRKICLKKNCKAVNSSRSTFCVRKNCGYALRKRKVKKS